MNCWIFCLHVLIFCLKRMIMSQKNLQALRRDGEGEPGFLHVAGTILSDLLVFRVFFVKMMIFRSIYGEIRRARCGLGGGKPIESSVRTWDLADIYGGYVFLKLPYFRFVHDDMFKTALTWESSRIIMSHLYKDVNGQCKSQIAKF